MDLKPHIFIRADGIICLMYESALTVTPIGEALLVKGKGGIIGVGIGDEGARRILQRLDRDIHDNPRELREEVKRLKAFFKGEKVRWSVDWSLVEDEEDKKILQVVRRINRGKTRTLSEVCEAAEASWTRSVVSALQENPLPLIVPSHRVLTDDGEAGDFGLGHQINTELLEMEK